MRRAAWLVVAALGGCDPAAKSEALPGEACSRVVDRQIECAEGRRKYVAAQRDESIAACRFVADRTVEDDRAALQCLALADCGEFTACAEQVETRRVLRKSKIAVATAVRAKLSDEASRLACATHGEDDAEIGQLCAELHVLTLAQAQAALQQLRDNGGFWDYRDTCEQWLAIAGPISKEARASVQGWCEEIGAAEVMRQLRQEPVEERYAIRGLPSSCEAALRKLDALRSPWAGERRQEAARICYVEIGKKLLPKLVAQAKSCEPPLDAFVREVRRYGFSDPGIDKWIARAERKCAPAEK